MKPIGYIHSDFKEKFGIPRQSGLVDSKAYITFEPPYNQEEAFRGLEEFSHIWLIWDFSLAHREGEPSLTVRPPRLGGNKRVGVFATRSPFRPNSLGLSCVEIEKIESSKDLGTVIHVKGADLLDETPIYDIKPYLPYADCKVKAKGGFAGEAPSTQLQVEYHCQLPEELSKEQVAILEDLLKMDPRPTYQEDPQRVYGMRYGDFNIKFRICANKIRVEEVTS